MSSTSKERPATAVPAAAPRPGEDYSGWMIVHSRGEVDLRRLTPDDIDVRDIVHSLSSTNRYNGQTRTPVSVLWHSLMVEAVCADRRPVRTLEALFHDAGEAYVGDWIRPLHGMMTDAGRALRSDVQETCFEAAGLERKGPGRSPGKLSLAVRKADDLMLRYEIQAPWGYGRPASWHTAPTVLERMRVEKAMAECGEPSRDPAAVDRWIERFLWLAHELVPRHAPMRRSIHETLVALTAEG